MGRVGGVQELDAHARIIKRQLCTYLRGESVRVSRRSLLHQSIIQHSTTNECALSHFSSPFLCPSERQHPLTCRQRLKASLLMRSQLQVKSRQSSPEWCVMCVWCASSFAERERLRAGPWGCRRARTYSQILSTPAEITWVSEQHSLSYHQIGLHHAFCPLLSCHAVM